MPGRVIKHFGNNSCLSWVQYHLKAFVKVLIVQYVIFLEIFKKKKVKRVICGEVKQKQFLIGIW